MIGYIIIYRRLRVVPKIGIKYRNHGSTLVFTKFKKLNICTPNCDIYKVEFTPDGSVRSALFGSGYKTKEYTVLELV